MVLYFVLIIYQISTRLDITVTVRGLTEISIIAVFILLSATLYATKKREQPRTGQESIVMMT